MNSLRTFAYKIWFALSILIVGCLLAPIVLIHRPFAIFVVNAWARAEILGLKLIRGIKFEIRGLEHMQNQKVLVASKHLSTMDTLVPFIMMNTPAFIFKKELFKIPIFGWYLKVGGMIGIDRDGGMKSLKSMVEEAKLRTNENRPILIYPEGTRMPLNAEPDYKPGVAAIYGMLNLPCVPLAHNTGVFWPYNKSANKSGTVIFEFLEPIETGLKRQEFMERLQNAIETKTNELIKEALEN